MWRACRLAVSLSATLCAAVHAAPALLIDGARLVDAAHDGEPVAIVIVGGTVREVAAPGALRAPDGARTIDGRGLFVVPGLVDAYVDLGADGGPAADAAPDAQALALVARRYLRSGVTTIHDRSGSLAGGDADPAPRRVPLGPALVIARGATPDPAALARRVGERIAGGGSRILIEVREQGPRAAAAVSAAIDAAHGAGARIAIASTSYATTRAALEAGADAVVGGVLDRALDAPWLAALAARGATYLPTLAAVESAERSRDGRLRLVPAEWVWGDLEPLDRLVAGVGALPRRSVGGLELALANARRVLQAGGTVAPGSAAGAPGVPHGPALHRELELLVAAGATPRQALVAASRGTEVLGGAASGGGIVPGAPGDLLVLDQDPRLSVRNLGQLVAVVRGGGWHAPAALLPERPSDVLARFDLAFDLHDAQVLATCFAEDATLQQGRNAVKGRTALREHHQRLFAARPALRRDVVDAIAEGDTVVQTVEERGSGPTRRYRASFEVRDGFVVRAWTEPAR